MKWKTWVPLVLAVVFGLLAVKVGRDILSKRAATNAAPVPTTPVVVALRTVEPGSILTTADLKQEEIALRNAPPDACKNREELTGRVIVVPMAKGQIVLDSMLAPRDSGMGLQAMVPAGMRAVTVEVSESGGVADLLVPGCRVDVLASFRDNQFQSITRTVAQDVKVSAVGKWLSPTEKQKETAEQRPRSRTVTLLVTPKQAEAVELAAANARPRLTLRGYGDHAVVASEGTNLSELTRQIHMGIEITNRVCKTLESGFKTLAAASANTTTRPAMAEIKPDAVKRTEASQVTPPNVWTVQVIRGGAESTVRMIVDPDTTVQPDTVRQVRTSTGGMVSD